MVDNKKLNIIKFFKILFSPQPKNYDWKCNICNKRFDGDEPEIFIKHQIDQQHYNCEKVLK